jgi:hypothetical protein
MSRIPTEAFGYTYTHLPEFTRDDLDSLEREGVIYADHLIDELEDFRHVRIAFTPEEAKDYARRCWAYELFLRAGSPRWAKDVRESMQTLPMTPTRINCGRRTGGIPATVSLFRRFLG